MPSPPVSLPRVVDIIMLRMKTEQKIGSLQLRPYNGPTNGSASRVNTTSRRYHSNNHTSSRRNAPVCKRYRCDCSGGGTVDEGVLHYPAYLTPCESYVGSYVVQDMLHPPRRYWKY